MAEVTILGVRHHGPGSARSVAQALAALQPDAVLIEGPPELDPIVETVLHPDCHLPVAALLHTMKGALQSQFYPLSGFSPEWRAAQWAKQYGATIGFIDLPAANSLALAQSAADDAAACADSPDGDHANGADQAAGQAVEQNAAEAVRDPIGQLAAAAGYDDPENFWEDAIEYRNDDALRTFSDVAAAMAELRVGAPLDTETARREAAMRLAIRKASKTHDTIAVVCGAYHAPALDPANYGKITDDRAVLRDLPKVRVAATWVPWSMQHLAASSGYGAGISAPGWYNHVAATWEHSTDDVVTSWLVTLAQALRNHHVPVPPASVLEAVRLSHSLATVRGRPTPGLAETLDAVVATICHGSDLPLQTITQEVLIGATVGSLPPEAKQLPLATDIAATQKSVRVKPSTDTKEVTIDLREPPQRRKSEFFHRLAILDIPWATHDYQGHAYGNFKELWQVCWSPQCELAIVDASLFGHTVLTAATAKLRAAAAESNLASLTAYLNQAMAANLPEVVPTLIRRIQQVSTGHFSYAELLASIPPLATASYTLTGRAESTEQTGGTGQLRSTAQFAGAGAPEGLWQSDDFLYVGDMFDELVVRAATVMPHELRQLAPERASDIADGLNQAHQSIRMIDRQCANSPWWAALHRCAADPATSAAPAGRLNRLLFDADQLSPGELSRRLAMALSPGHDLEHGLEWLSAFLAGDCTILAYDTALLSIIDNWMTGLSETAFLHALPLLRKTFHHASPAALRTIAGLLVSQPGGESDGVQDVDPELVSSVLHSIAHHVGLEVTKP